MVTWRRLQWRIAAAYVALLVCTMVVLGVYLARLASDLSPTALAVGEARAMLERVVVALSAALIVASAVAVLLAVAIARFVSRPVAALAEAARSLPAGETRPPIVAEGNLEVEQLAQALNEMATALRQRMAALQGQRRLSAAVLEHLGDGLVIVDEQRRVVLLNPAARRMLSVPGDVERRPWIQVARDADLQRVLERALAAGERRVEIVRLGGGGPYLRVQVTPLAGAGEAAALITLQDVTEMRRLEAVRREFVANVSHDLRTPLASIKAVVETLEAGALEDPTVARRFLGTIHGEVDSLTEMVRELLELARIESGEVWLNLAPQSPYDLAARAVERLLPQAERAGLTLEMDVPAGLPPVLADAESIHHVLVNLLHNAVKFTPVGGTVRVTAEASDGRLAFTVRDTGPGIDPDDLERVFERFYKGDRSRAGGGTGLGLSIAKHAVQAHGGRIWATNARPGGAQFTFTLPLDTRAAPSPTPSLTPS